MPGLQRQYARPDHASGEAACQTMFELQGRLDLIQCLSDLAKKIGAWISSKRGGHRHRPLMGSEGIKVLP